MLFLTMLQARKYTCGMYIMHVRRITHFRKTKINFFFHFLYILYCLLTCWKINIRSVCMRFFFIPPTPAPSVNIWNKHFLFDWIQTRNFWTLRRLTFQCCHMYMLHCSSYLFKCCHRVCIRDPSIYTRYRSKYTWRHICHM